MWLALASLLLLVVPACGEEGMPVRRATPLTDDEREQLAAIERTLRGLQAVGPAQILRVTHLRGPDGNEARHHIGVELESKNDDSYELSLNFSAETKKPPTALKEFLRGLAEEDFAEFAVSPPGLEGTATCRATDRSEFASYPHSICIGMTGTFQVIALGESRRPCAEPPPLSTVVPLLRAALALATTSQQQEELP
jgi:hypothetical protein